MLEVELSADDGSAVLTVTEEHPLWTRNGWTAAGELGPGDEVLERGGAGARVARIGWTGRTVTVYNFEVHGTHSYAVGAGGAWAHNTCSAAKANKPFAMGLTDQGLDAFAAAREADTWKNLPDPARWRSGVLEKLADPETMVHFNLEGVDAWGGVSRAAAGRGGPTDWELLQIYQNPHWWESIQFWRGGVSVPNPFQ